MFSPEFGIDEDPATGSAVAALPGAVQDFDDMPDGDHAAIIEQGFEMGRPSLIRLEVTIAGGAIERGQDRGEGGQGRGGDAGGVGPGLGERASLLPVAKSGRKPVKRPRELSRVSAVRFADLPLFDLAALKARTLPLALALLLRRP